MSKGTVLVVLGRFPEVSQTFVVDHIRGLAACGWTVHVAAREIDAQLVASSGVAEVVAGVHRITAPPRRAALQRAVAIGSLGGGGVRHLRSVVARSAAYHVGPLRDVIADVRPSVVHAHFAHNGILAALAVAGRIPVLVNYHGFDVLELPQSNGWAPYRRFLRGTVGVVHSTFLEEQVAAHLEVELRRVTLGVDPSLFGTADRGRVWPAEVRLLTVGRLAAVKGHDTAIEALAHLRREGSFHLSIVGDGPARPELESRAKCLGVEDRVEFLGAQPPTRVAEEMSKADVLLVPSRKLRQVQEGFCRVAVEGMASGLAVIGTQTGGLAETIGTGGTVVSPDDPAELAEAVRRTIAGSSPADIAARATNRAADFQLERMWREYDAVTSDIALKPAGL